MYTALHFSEQGMFGNFVYLVSKNSITGLTDLHTHFQSIMNMRFTSAKYLKRETKTLFSTTKEEKLTGYLPR